MPNNIFYLIILVLGFPVGLILAKLCKDEIKKWRRGLLITSGIYLVLIIGILFINIEYKIPVIISLGFMIITNMGIIWKNYYKIKNNKLFIY